MKRLFLKKFLPLKFIAIVLFFYSYEISAQIVAWENTARQGTLSWEPTLIFALQNKNILIASGNGVIYMKIFLLDSLGNLIRVHDYDCYDAMHFKEGEDGYRCLKIKQIKEAENKELYFSGMVGSSSRDGYFYMHKADSTLKIIEHTYKGDTVGKVPYITTAYEYSFCEVENKSHIVSFFTGNKIIKVDSTGAELWRLNLTEGGRITYSNATVMLNSGNYALLRNVDYLKKPLDILKISKQGQVLDTVVLPKNSFTSGVVQMLKTDDGGVLIYGEKLVTDTFNIQYKYINFMRLDSNLRIVWEKIIDDVGIPSFYFRIDGVTRLNNRSYLLYGHEENGKAFMICVDDNGRVKWTKKFDDTQSDVNSISQFTSVASVGYNGILATSMVKDIFYVVKIYDSIPTLSLPYYKPQNNVSLSPNPAQSVLNIRLSKELSIGGELSLYDNIGKKVMSKIIPKGANELRIDVSSLLNGVYSAVIKQGTTTITKKVVVAK